MTIDTEFAISPNRVRTCFWSLASMQLKRLICRLNRISDTKALKEQLMNELSNWIADNHPKQAEAAGILIVSRPRVSDWVNKKTGKFTIDTLVDMLSRVGKPVRLAIGSAV